jgi:hypothetical protein
MKLAAVVMLSEYEQPGCADCIFVHADSKWYREACQESTTSFRSSKYDSFEWQRNMTVVVVSWAIRQDPVVLDRPWPAPFVCDILERSAGFHSAAGPL